MRLGFALPISGAWATPDNIVSVARDAEQHGFRGLWTFQRWLADASLAGVYQNVLDPMILLGYAAAVTTRARLGLAIVNGPFYAPIAIAKQFAALDVLSGGRLDGGVGLGWSPAEYTPRPGADGASWPPLRRVAGLPRRAADRRGCGLRGQFYDSAARAHRTPTGAAAAAAGADRRQRAARAAPGRHAR